MFQQYATTTGVNDAKSGVWATVILVLVAGFMISGNMIPLNWSDNEINYFDLSHRYVAPDAYGPQHSVFDTSNARFLSFTLIGVVVEWIGFEHAKSLFGLVSWVLYALVLALLARSMRVSVPALAIGLFAFLAMGQSLLADEWLFGTVEAKIFAYIAVIFGLSLAMANRFAAAICLMAIATYFHFLVGAFWFLAVLGLHLIWARKVKATLVLGLSFTVIVLPVVVILAMERLGAAPDMSGLDLSLANIYAEFRNPHHVAPFAQGLKGFLYFWLPPILYHTVFAALFVVLHQQSNREDGPPLYLWLVGLNGYVLVATLIATVDQNTHALAPFYVFRPMSLILLLSCLAGAGCLISNLAVVRERVIVPVLFTCIAGISVLPNFGNKAVSSLSFGWLDRIERQRDAAEADLAAWIEANTDTDTAIVLEPLAPMGSIEEGVAGRASLERTTGRPFVVNYKFVPTASEDMAEWYRRLSLRAAFFAGDCGAGQQLGAQIVVFVHAETRNKTAACTTVLYENSRFSVASFGTAS